MRSEAASRGRQLAGDAVWGLAADWLALPTGLVTAAYLGRRLGPDGYGLFALATAVAVTIEWTLSALLSRATIKLASESGDWRPVAVAAVRAHLCLGLAAGLALWVLAGPIAAWLDAPALASALRVFAVELPVFSLFAAWRAVLIGAGRARLRAVTTGVRWLARLPLVVLLVEAGWSANGAIAGGAAALALAWAVGRLAAGRVQGSQATPLARLWQQALPLFLLAVSLQLFDRLGLVLLRALGAPVAEAGRYAAAHNLGLPFTLAAQSVSPLLLAALSRAFAGGTAADARRLGRATLRVAAWTLPFAALAAGASNDLLALVYGRSFAGAGGTGALLIMAGVVAALVNVATSTLVAANRSVLALGLALAALPLNIIAALVLFPVFGPVGVAAATLAAGCVSAAGVMIAVSRACGVGLPAGTAWRSGSLAVVGYLAVALCPIRGAFLVSLLPLFALIMAAAWLLSGEFSGEDIYDIAALAGSRRVPGPLATRGNAAQWDSVAGAIESRGHYLDEVLGVTKRNAHLDLVRRWAPPLRGARVLKTDLFEEAHGPDTLAADIAGAGARVVGCDISARVAARARERLKPAVMQAVVTDVRQPGFMRQAFDLVLSFSTLDHFATRAEINVALAALASLLRPGGMLIVTLDNPRNVADPLLRLADVAGLLPYPLGATMTAGELRGALAGAGFEVKASTAILHHPRLAAVALAAIARRLHSRQVSAMAGWAIARLQWLERMPMRERTGCFIAAAATRSGQ